MHFGTTSWSEHGIKMALCPFIYGAINKQLCYQRMLHVQYTSIDDFLITTTYKNNIATLWRTWHIIVSGPIVASLLSLCMTK